MTVHQCPKCELRFRWPTELEDHCRSDHPEFHHEYPARSVAPEPPPVVRVAGQPMAALDPEAAADILATYWNER